MLKRNAALLTFTLGVIDGLCALGAFALATYLAPFPEGVFSFGDAVRDRLIYLFWFIVLWCLAAADQHLFESQRHESLQEQVWALAKALIFALVLSALISIYFRGGLENEFTAAFLLGTLAFIVLFRVGLRLTLWQIRSRGFNFRQIVVIGANKRARHFAEVITSRGQYGYVLRGVLDDEPERMESFDGMEVEYLGPLRELENLLTREVIDEVYITLPVRSFYEQIQVVANRCESIGIPVRLVADFFPLRIARSRVHLMEDVPVISMSAVPEQFFQLAVKRCIDIAASTLGLAILIPVLFIPLAILIKLESRGPVFFAQERIGLNRRRFKMLKFRSMVANAEAIRKELEELNEADGPVFKIRNDPRITRIGRFIRKYSLDEFPQLINVWLGDMSLVGPRPPIPSEVEEYTWEERRRLSVRPGMTGLWQVSGRSDTSFEEWVRLDLQYIDTWSLFLDIHILWRTYGAVIKGRGAA